MLLGRLGRHQSALWIFVRRLQDLMAAERYCEDAHRGNSLVYLHLLQVMLEPNVVAAKETEEHGGSVDMTMMLDEAINVLARHGDRIEVPHV